MRSLSILVAPMCRITYGLSTTLAAVALAALFLLGCEVADTAALVQESDQQEVATRTTQTWELWEPLNYLNTDSWHTADWANGGFFYCGWNPDNVTFSDGVWALALNDTVRHGLPYSGGELRSNNTFSYGYFETNMKAAAQSGTVTSFFLYTGDPWDEIDVEILGKNTWQVQ